MALDESRGQISVWIQFLLHDRELVRTLFGSQILCTNVGQRVVSTNVVQYDAARSNFAARMEPSSVDVTTTARWMAVVVHSNGGRTV